MINIIFTFYIFLLKNYIKYIHNNIFTVIVIVYGKIFSSILIIYVHKMLIFIFFVNINVTQINYNN
jgi:hypothetical protein